MAVFGAACDWGVDRKLRELDAMRERRDAASIERLRTLAADPDPDVRGLAWTLLAIADPGTVKEKVVDAMSDPDPGVRASAVKIVGDLRVTRGEGTLARLLVSDPSPSVRRRAATALGAVASDGAAEALAKGLGDPDAVVREEAARALRSIDAAPAAEALVRVLQLDPEWRVRVQAVQALARVESDEARAAVEAAASDPNEFVRLEAREVLP